MITLEIACNSLQSCAAAAKAGAHRIELFENIADGGCTPSAGSIKASLQYGLPIYVMIRPKAGNFVYNTAEIDAMYTDIEICKTFGAHGIVFGCLNKDNSVDQTLNKALLNAWGGPATFHRAIDRSNNYFKSIEQIIDLGFERVLSSGAEANVDLGLNNLSKAIQLYGQHIDIMPGAGVNSKNIQHIIQTTGCKSIHATCKTILQHQGIGQTPDSETISDEESIRDLLGEIRAKA
jgi:copper homeostasis protein